MKTTFALIVILLCSFGCSSSDGNTNDAPQVKAKTDANGVETLPSGTVIQRSDNGDK